jgi:UDP-hydrolysing UDP-N-acetyl-D-glucosamine 2-epimerase
LKIIKKIIVVTTNRSDFGLLRELILKLGRDKRIILNLIVSGAHLVSRFGNTLTEVRNVVKKKFIKINFNYSNPSFYNNTILISNLIRKFSKIIKLKKPDHIILFGDRFEVLAFAYASAIMNINLIHIGGGEKTSGSVDDNFRNAISKLSHYHFVTHLNHKKRLIQMGERKENIFVVGSPGIEMIKKTKIINKKNLFKFLKINDFKKKILLISFYPETASESKNRKDIKNLLNAIKKFLHMHIIFTLPNIDSGSDLIIKEINKFKKKYDNIKVYYSLGSEKFISLLNFCEIFIGNSSSGLIEAPFLGTKVLNIGNRQSNRLKPREIFNCKCITKDIVVNIRKILTLKKIKYKKIYINHEPSGKIKNLIFKLDPNILLKKFQDINFRI